MEVEIYGKDGCSHCTNAKTMCEMTKTNFVYKNLDKGEYKKEDLLSRMGVEPDARITMPQCFVDGTLVGGASDLFAFLLANRNSA
jgi:glutaredoxin